MADREALGRLVREVWVEWAREQPDPKPSHLVGWDDLDEGNREVDMRIGEALYAERESDEAAWGGRGPSASYAEWKAEGQPIMRTGRHLSQTDGLCTLYRVTGDAGGDWTQHECVGMAKTPEIAEAICEAVNARGIPLPGGDDLPTADQIGTWLLRHSWRPSDPGKAGSLWYPPHGEAVIIPHEDGDTFATTGALKRIAERSHLTVGQVTQEMLSTDA